LALWEEPRQIFIIMSMGCCSSVIPATGRCTNVLVVLFYTAIYQQIDNETTIRTCGFIFRDDNALGCQFANYSPYLVILDCKSWTENNMGKSGDSPFQLLLHVWLDVLLMFIWQYLVHYNIQLWIQILYALSDPINTIMAVI
jgi:hypothetical protein